jgi:two-component system, NtrC family, response regulator AtoC
MAEGRQGSGETSTDLLAPSVQTSGEGFRLLVLSGAGARELSLPAAGTVVIGRADSCAVRIDDSSVSRRHAELVLGREVRVRDLGSANGVFVRGRALPKGASCELGPGESIDVGRVTLLLQRRLADEAEPSSTGSATAAFGGPSTVAHAATGGAASATEPPPRVVVDADAAVVVVAPEMARLYELVRRVAPREINVLVLGETGTGKEVVAQAIHDASARARGPLVRVNCTQFNPNLLESELFGHEQGAFTGANRAKPGLFETANGGTIFLDEIGELPLAAQVKLLRVIEERKILRVGGVSARTLDVRIVAATHRDLKNEAGDFRRDLYFRLSGVTIHVPPLRERLIEIQPLAHLFARRFAAPRPAPRLSGEAIRALETYAWPGNVRELRNVIEHAVVMAEDVVTVEHLPEEIRAPSAASLAPPPSTPLRGQILAIERQRIIDALRAADGNQSRAAEILGMPRRTLVDKLRRYQIPRPRGGPS